jgi:two-component system response regulator NreC
LQVVDIAHTQADGLRASEEHEPDLLVLDLALPDGDGTEVARQLAKRNPQARTIILSGQAATFVVPRVLRSHVQAVVEKTKAYSVLQREVLQILSANSAASATPDPDAALSKREREVFRELGRGQTNKEIAGRLGISPATVALHRKRVAAKLNARGSELVRLATLHHRTDM